MLDWSKPARKYEEMALDLVRIMGIKNGSIPVISRKDHPQQWRDWYAYYGFRGLLASQEIMRNRDEKTVPTHSPFDFDAEFVLAKLAPPVPRDGETNRPPPTLEQKMRAQKIMAEARWIGSPPPATPAHPSTQEAAE